MNLKKETPIVNEKKAAKLITSKSGLVINSSIRAGEYALNSEPRCTVSPDGKSISCVL